MNILIRLYYFNNTIANYTKNLLEKELDNIVCWYSVFFLFGCASFFSLFSYINPYYPLCILLILIISIFFSKKFLISIFLKFFLFFTLGITISSLKYIYLSKNYILETPIRNIILSGIIESSKPNKFGYSYVLTNISTNQIEQNKIPKKIKINLSYSFDKIIFIGDRLEFSADLLPTEDDIMPGGYSFKRTAFFNEIGAIAVVKSTPLIINFSKSKFNNIISLIRKKIFFILKENLGYSNGNFAAAIFLGETGGIDKKTLENARLSGISHILCVSGLHLGIVAMLGFLTLRFFLNFSNYIAFNYDIKKISAILSIFISFIYLSLTGFQIAASRAFIMTSLVLFSITLDRSPSPMRSLSIAVFFLLFKNPEYVLSPSFQLSFIAVTGLISFYEYYKKNQDKFAKKNYGILGKLRLYIFGNIISTSIASFSTSVIVIYHFYNFSNFSLITNLIAVPLISFIIIPLGIISILLSLLIQKKFFLSNFIYSIINQSIDIINFTSKKYVSMPFAITHFGKISDIYLILFICGILWFLLISQKSRLLGLILSVIVILLIILQTIFNHYQFRSIINFEKQFIAIQNKELHIFHKNKLSHFEKEYIKNWFGSKEIKKYKIKYENLVINIKPIKKSIDKPKYSNYFNENLYLIDFTEKKICKINIENETFKNNMTLVEKLENLYIFDIKKIKLKYKTENCKKFLKYSSLLQ